MTKKSIALAAIGLTLMILAVSAEVLPDLFERQRAGSPKGTGPF